MDSIASSWLKKFDRDPTLEGVPSHAARLFAIKISNLIKKGHDVEFINFYRTSGSQCKPGRGPYLRAMMNIDGKLNRFWFYWFEPGLVSGGKYVWQNTTKQYESKKRGNL